MPGIRSSACTQRFLALSLLALTGSACDEALVPHQLGLQVRFPCDADRAQARSVHLRVLASRCDASPMPVYDVTLGRGEEAPALGGLAPGAYGVEVSALAGAEERVLASACVDVALPREQPIEIELRSNACLARSTDPTLRADAAVIADAAMIDAAELPPMDLPESAPDAAPSICDSDCSDSDPCTDDVCVGGVCSHLPFTGPRECDGVPCTDRDTCLAGACQPGTPNHAACPDDGNTCTGEVCVAGVGCNRSSAAVDGATCDDGIACTVDDTCKDGICNGKDSCGSGRVCSAAQRVCLACVGAPDCDDSDPCTNDSCNLATGTCEHSDNTARCDDGQACTGNDTCAAGRCAGTSTCPSDATCGGSACSCNDPGETLCGNSCVNLASSALHCGLCGRACEFDATCENGACKPAAASACTAYRASGHDYLLCTDRLVWTAARDRCRSFDLILGKIDSQGENDFLRDRIGDQSRWVGANDRGDNGTSCRRSSEEGTWYWAGRFSDDAFQFCTANASGPFFCDPDFGRFQNFASGEPNNSNCSCNGGVCTEGQDCGTLRPGGLWDDDFCDIPKGYVCETF